MDKPSSHTHALVKKTFQFKRILQVVASNDNSQVVISAFSLKTKAQKKYWETQLYLKRIGGKTLSILKSTDTVSSLVWSWDGQKLACIRKNSLKHESSIWIYDIHQRSFCQLLACKQDIIALKWSPNNKQIAFIAEDLSCEPSENCLQSADASQTEINVRLYLIAAYRQQKPRITAITQSDFSISHELNGPSFDWSPDGGDIAFAYQPNPSFDAIKQSKIAMVHLKTRQIIKIPYTEKHPGVNPIFSPDGQWLAFAANELNNDIALYRRMGIVDLKNPSQFYYLSNTPNESPTPLGWDKECQGIYVYDFHKTQGPQIYFLNLDAAKGPQFISAPKGYIHYLTLSLNNSHTAFGLAHEAANEPPEGYISPANLNSLQLTPVSQFNRDLKKSLGQIELAHWHSKDGKEIEGLLIKPPHYRPKKKYPLYLILHGSPCVWSERYLGGLEEYGLMFNVTDCMSVALNLGFIIFKPNFRGSTGYGRDFRVANSMDWGGQDYEDIMSGVDDLIRKGMIDETRMVIAGWSYGAYLTNLIIGRNQRFKAAIALDGMTNLISLVGTSDAPDLIKKDIGCFFWEKTDLYWQHSPLALVKNIQTPLLLLHGAKDMRVPITQAYELYQALIQQHKKVSLLVFPQDGHAPCDPHMIWAAIAAIAEWMRRAL